MMMQNEEEKMLKRLMNRNVLIGFRSEGSSEAYIWMKHFN